MKIEFIANSGQPMQIADNWLEQVDTQTIRVPLTDGTTARINDIKDMGNISVPLLCDHNLSVKEQAGTITNIMLNDNNIIATAELNDTPAGQLIQKLASDGNLKNNFSITVEVENMDDISELGDNGIIMHNGLMTEISVVWCGADLHATLLEVVE